MLRDAAWCCVVLRSAAWYDLMSSGEHDPWMYSIRYDRLAGKELSSDIHASRSVIASSILVTQQKSFLGHNLA